MDEVKPVEENVTTNGRTSTNLVMNEDEEFQNISNGPAIRQESLTDSKPSDSPIDDRLKPSSETAIQQKEEKQPDYKLSVMKGDFTGQNHVQEDGPRYQRSPLGLSNSNSYNQEETSRDANQDLEKVSSEKTVEKSKSFSAEIDTTAPFESVKAAVSMFKGIVDWKKHKIQIAERRTFVAQELRKANEQIPILKKQSQEAEESKQQVLKELDNTKRLLEELKLNLERAETEEQQAKQDAELAKLRVEEMEQGVEDESSVAAKTQLEVAQARHQGAVTELKTVKTDLINLKKDYVLLLSDRDLAIKNASEAVVNSKEIERKVEGLTIKLITMKEELESAHAAHLEAEENRTAVSMARDEEVLNWDEELKKSEQELAKVDQQIIEVEELKLKLDKAFVLLQSLKAELTDYMEQNHEDIQSQVDSVKMDLEELKKNIEKETDEVNRLKDYAASLNMELKKEKETLVAAKEREEFAAVPISELEVDLKKAISEVELIQTKEKEARERTLQMPKQLEQVVEEADQAKSRVQNAQQEVQKAKEVANQAKDGENNMISKLNVTLKEIEATRASERLALGAISALHESELVSNESELDSKITLSVEDYYDLSRQAKEAEDEATYRVSEAISQIELAKESESNAKNELEQVNTDAKLKKEQLSSAMRRVENANEGKEALEQELKTFRSEHEKKLKINASRNFMSFFSGKSPKSAGGSRKPDSKAESINNGVGSSEGQPRKKKKRSFFPRFFMFFTRKKGHSSSKKNT